MVLFFFRRKIHSYNGRVIKWSYTTLIWCNGSILEAILETIVRSDLRLFFFYLNDLVYVSKVDSSFFSFFAIYVISLSRMALERTRMPVFRFLKNSGINLWVKFLKPNMAILMRLKGIVGNIAQK